MKNSEGKVVCRGTIAGMIKLVTDEAGLPRRQTGMAGANQGKQTDD